MEPAIGEPRSLTLGKMGKKERCGVQNTGIIGGAVEDEEEEDKRGGFPSPHISSFD